MPFHVGLDLGQSADYTALAVVQDVTKENPGGGTEKYLHLRHLERYELRTPYPEIATKVASLMQSPELSPQSTTPQGGATPVGRPSSSWTIPAWGVR